MLSLPNIATLPTVLLLEPANNGTIELNEAWSELDHLTRKIQLEISNK